MNWPLFIAAIVVADLLITVGLVWAVVRLGWGPLPARFPAREPADDAVRRNFQSFRLGLMNLGFSVHVAVDDEHLHLTLVKPFRWAGAKPASIPWSAIEPRRRYGKRWLKVMVAGNTLIGPVWCLELAGSEETGD